MSLEEYDDYMQTGFIVIAKTIGITVCFIFGFPFFLIGWVYSKITHEHK